MQPRVNIDLLIVKDGKILLGLVTEKWRDGKPELWGLPGKDLLAHETIETACKRMLQEEFSCGMQKFRVSGVTENFAYRNHYISIGVEVTPDKELRMQPSDDFERWEWHAMNHLPRHLFGAAKQQIDQL